MIYLLLQAAQVPGNSQQALATEISVHPYVALGIIIGLFGLLGGLVKVLLYLLEGRINEKFSNVAKDFAEISGHEEAQDRRLDKIERDIKEYDKHVAVGVRETGEIHSAITRVAEALDRHTEKEETQTWGKIDSLVEAVNSMKLDNAEAHAGMLTQQAVLDTRLGSVEKKIPNGELARLADAFEALSRKSGPYESRLKKRSARGSK